MTIEQLISELEQYDKDTKIDSDSTVKEILDKLKMDSDIAYFMSLD